MLKQLTFLCDNTAAPHLECEWGLSVALEFDNGHLWLWDTGQTDLFLRNAAKLEITPHKADGLALSHGHYDHTGGLSALMEHGFRGDILAHPQAEAQRYSHRKTLRPIGPPVPLPRFTPVERTATPEPGMTMITDIPRQPGLFQAVRDFSLDTEGKRPDPVPDDAFLMLETRQGPLVLLGCCHSGLENSLLELQAQTGRSEVFAVVGGLHLHNAGEAEWEATAQALERFHVQKLAMGHCTGENAIQFLENRLNCECLRTYSGLRLSLP